MKDHDRHNEWFVPSESSNIKDSVHNSRVSNFVEKTHSKRTLNLVSGFFQILLGIVVISLSVLGFIRPLWVSTFASMVASITTMIGIGLVYVTIRNSRDSKALLRKAMKRVMESKN